MSMPIITLLERVPSQPWFIRVLRITMVLDSEMQAPSHSDAFHPQPVKEPIPKPRPMVRMIWMGVPMRAIFLTGLRSLRENSRPRANSNNATPISASRSISGMLETIMPPVCGPRMIPAAM